MSNIDCEKCIHYQVCCGYTSKEAIAESNRAMNNGESLLCFMYAPTADVVEVVRCKDCKHCFHYIRRNYERYECTYEGCSDEAVDYVEPTHYCSYGEKKTD